MPTYAIVETGGKQYRVEEGQSLLVDRLPGDEGAKVDLRAVMFRSDDDTVLEPKQLEKVKVAAKIAGHERGEKVRVFKYKAKKGYRKRRGHRSELTRLEVTEVTLAGAKGGAKKAAAKKAEDKPAAKAEPKKAEEGATKKAEPKKAAAKATEKGEAKPAEKAKPKQADAKKDGGEKGKEKSEPKKAAAKKPAAKKPAAKKDEAEKPAAAKKAAGDGEKKESD